MKTELITLLGKIRGMALLPALLIVLLPLGASVQAQIWTVEPPLLNPRSEHGAATGPDGLVYVVGGMENQSSNVGTMEKYNPLLGGTWSTVAPMSVQRCRLAFVFATDGYLYAIGGSIGNQSTSLVERYNTATGVWATMAPLNVKRSQLAAAVGPDGRIYAIGGYDSPNGTNNLTTVEVYNPPSVTFPLGQWVPAPSLPAPLANHHAVTGLDGNIYVFDGTSGNKWYTFNGTQWTAKGALSSTLGGCAAVTGPNGLMYLLDVEPNIMTGSKLVTAYTPNGLSSVTVPNLLQGRTVPGAATSAEGSVFVTGGYRKLNGDLKYVEKFSPLKAPDFNPNYRALWRFDEANGATVIDSKGTNNGTVVANAVHNLAGRVGKSLIFNGTGAQYVKVNTAAGINFGSGSMTVEGWIKWVPATGTGVIPILDKRTQAGNKYQGYHLFIGAGGKLGFQLANGTTYQNYGATQTTIQANQWTHIAVTVDRTSGNPAVSIYVNSVLDKTFVPLQGNITNPAPLHIGKHAFASTYFKGEMDEVALYDRSLRWAEIRAIFLAGKQGKQ